MYDPGLAAGVYHRTVVLGVNHNKGYQSRNHRSSGINNQHLENDVRLPFTVLSQFANDDSAICLPIAIFLWAIGLLLYFGLPNYYRQTSGKVPSFYKTVFRRKIILWNFAVVIIQNWFLSAPYGRNWSCKPTSPLLHFQTTQLTATVLWSSNHASAWQIGILFVVFFGIIWALSLLLFGHLSKSHSWVLPVFACGLGAPR